ncbi:50S ribosomal protein L11 methyltransferase [bacterium]|nr:50S ribosomal protein L11 methyltransferase [candidate division CSSED10-310 bacterium]
MEKGKIWPYLDICAEPSVREWYVMVCWENGAIGVVEDCPNEGTDRVYFSDPAKMQMAADQLAALQPKAPPLTPHHSDGSPRVQAGEVKDPGWRTAWHAFFQPVNVGRTFRILPSWDIPPVSRLPDVPGGRIPLIIHPGQAFGTGHHETTTGCLRMLEDIDPAGTDVYDAGCGSGILGIAAARLGARSVTGRDHETEAVEEARHNSSLNHVEPICTWHCSSVTDENNRFHLVLANLNIQLLVTIQGFLVDRLLPGGQLLISGYLVRDREAVETGFLTTGAVQCAVAETVNDWAVARFVRKHEA